MEQIIVAKADGTTWPLLRRSAATTIVRAEQRKTLLGEDVVSLVVESAIALPFDIGDSIRVFSQTYRLNALPKLTKSSRHSFTYDAVFESSQYDMMRVAFMMEDTGTSSIYGDFTLTGTMAEFATVIVNNLLRVFPGKWTLGTYPETLPQTYAFSNENCLQVLQSLCSAEKFNLEFEILEDESENKVINIKTAIGQVIPGTYYYGRGKGIYGLTRRNVSNKNIITRLYAFGSQRNLQSAYRGYSQRLKLPGVDQSYIEDATAVAAFGVIEGIKVFEEIYPRHKGTVSGLGSTIYKFVDSSMSFDLNATDGEGNTLYLISGLSAKIHFNTGSLAGYEFEIVSYTHATKEFTLKSFEDERGQAFPDPDSAAFRVGVGDEYVILDITMPEAYITAAENDLQTAAEEFLEQNCQPRVSYDMMFDETHLKQLYGGTGSIPNVFSIGDYVTVSDSDISVNKSIRIKSFSRDIIDYYKYILDLSDLLETSTLQRLVASNIETEKTLALNNLADPARAMRSWKSTREVLDMIFDTDGYFDGGKIRPESIETLMLSVGARSGQFSLGVLIDANYEGDPDSVNVTGGTLSHYGIEDTIKDWTITSGLTTLLDSGAYYIYAKCSKSDTAGLILFSQDQIKVDDDPNYYHFLIGILHKVDTPTNTRLISITYGATTINGRIITTGRIQSMDGYNYLDLDENKFRVGGASSGLDWNVTAANTLTLKGALVQSPAGQSSPITVFRGAYDSGTTYYKGDLVTYLGSSFLYINTTPSSGNTPAEGVYWTVMAAAGTGSEPGADGEDGNYVEMQFAKNGSTSTPPSIVVTDLNPSGWSLVPPSTGALEYLWMTRCVKNYAGTVLVTNWSTPVRIKGEVGATGATGATGPTGPAGSAGPAGVFQGVYNASTTYYGTATRADIVKYGSSYYIARVDAPGGSFSGQTPTNTAYWNTFGANFESVATSLLFAELAYIDNLGVKYFNGIPVTAGNLAGSVVTTTANKPDIYRVVLTGSGGSAGITCNGITRTATFNGSLAQTCADFVATYAGSFPGLTLAHTPGLEYFTFTGIISGASVANISGDLYGNASHTQTAVKRKDTITLTGDSGEANILCDGVIRKAYFNSTLAITAADFAAANAASWTPGGVAVTSSGNTVVLESTVAGQDFTGSTTITNSPVVARGAIKMQGNSIWEDNENSDTGSLMINMKGYAGGLTKYRTLHVGDGKGNSLLQVGGANFIGLKATSITVPNLPRTNPGGGSANFLWIDSSGYLRIGT